LSINQSNTPCRTGPIGKLDLDGPRIGFWRGRRNDLFTGCRWRGVGCGSLDLGNGAGRTGSVGASAAVSLM